MIESTLRSILINDAAVKAITVRCYPATLPQNPVYPLILYYRITGLPENTLTGLPEMVYSRFQIDSWALTYSGAKTLARAITGALNAKAYTQDGIRIGSIVQQGERDNYESEVSCYRVILDFTLLHN
jgi:hypothetical protein